MRKNRPDAAVLLVLAGFLLLGAVLAHDFRGRINPDGISYIAVAEHVVHGRWAESVNGYWAPLYPWLMTPFVALGMAGPLAGRVVGLLAGLAALAGAWRLARAVGAGPGALRALLAALALPFALYGTASLTPDLLFLAIWLHYLALVHDPGFGAGRRRWVLAGLLGGLGYLAKAYGFYVFLLHFGLLVLVRLAAAPPAARRRLVTGALLGAAVFAACALPWMGALGAKYGGLSVSTSGAYNRALFGPGTKGQPMEHLGFLPPVNPWAVSVWEDPSDLPVADWSPLAGLGEAKHQALLLVRNLRRLALAVVLHNYAALVALPLAVATVLRRRRGGPWPGEAPLLGAMAVFPVGYLLVWVEMRYVWVTVVCGIVVAVLVAERWTGGRRALTGLALAAVVAGCWVAPLRSLRAGSPLPAGTDATVARLAAVATQGQRLAADDRWMAGIAVAYRAGLRYHGVRGDLDGEDAARALAAQGVDWYLAWDPAAAAEAQGWGWTPLAGGAAPDGAIILKAPARP